MRARRRRLSGQTFTQNERHCVFQRRVGAVQDFIVTAVAIVVFHLGGKVHGHAGHAICANALDAATLDGFENIAGGTGGRRELPVHPFIVDGGGQRHAVGETAEDGEFLARRHTRGLRQRHLMAVEFWFAGAEMDDHIFVAGDRTGAEA